MYPCAMDPDGSLGMRSIWATHPKRLGGIAEFYATEASLAARAADLRQAGYLVDTFFSWPAQPPSGSSGRLSSLGAMDDCL